MPDKDFLNDKEVYQAYDRWINGPTLFDHFDDEQRFYDFVIACVRYVKYKHHFVKKEVAWKSINMDTLRKRLEIHFAELKANNFSAFDERVHEILVKFETLIEYEKRRHGRVSWHG